MGKDIEELSTHKLFEINKFEFGPIRAHSQKPTWLPVYML